MPPPTDPDWPKLARDLSERVAAFAPEWTDRTDTDPGITIVELFGFLAENLLGEPERSSRVRTRLRDVLARLDGGDDEPCPDGTLTRVRYFDRQLVTAEDLREEQAYHRAGRRRHNVELHGTGIVRGLEVGVEGPPGQGSVVVVSPGVAIAPDGEELVVCEARTILVRKGKPPLHVVLRFAEREVATTTHDEASRIEESATIAVVEDVPQGDLPIARLTRHGRKWLLDATFKPARSGQ